LKLGFGNAVGVWIIVASEVLTAVFTPVHRPTNFLMFTALTLSSLP
jgi:hypothetical protein